MTASMADLSKHLAAQLDWAQIGLRLDEEGYVVLPGAWNHSPAESIAAALYEPLSRIANRWNEAMGVHDRYPSGFNKFLAQNEEAGLSPPRSLLSRLQEQDYLPLHQHPQGGLIFPLQCVMVLSEPGKDFTGGEFVMTEQRPRMQSRPMVLPLQLGAVAVIAVGHRPVRGSRDYYRVNTKHAISRVHSGERIGLELLFNGP